MLSSPRATRTEIRVSPSSSPLRCAISQPHSAAWAANRPYALRMWFSACSPLGNSDALSVLVWVGARTDVSGLAVLRFVVDAKVHHLRVDVDRPVGLEPGLVSPEARQNIEITELLGFLAECLVLSVLLHVPGVSVGLDRDPEKRQRHCHRYSDRPARIVG